jgi:nucleoid-associated protein YgaU
MRLLVALIGTAIGIVACGGDDPDPFARTPGPTPMEAEATPFVDTATPVCTPSIYVVESGDTLLAIAVRFGVDMDEIAHVNQLADADALQIGQELRIPCPDTDAAPSPEPDDGPAG